MQKILNFTHQFVVGSGTNIIIPKLSCVVKATENDKYYGILETRIFTHREVQTWNAEK